MAIEFFGEVDLNPKGKPSADYPSWYFSTLLEELKEKIDAGNREIKRGVLSDDKKEKLIKKIAKLDERYSMIISSREKVRKIDKDKLVKVTKELEKDIKDAMFSESDIKRRLVDPHEEARRMIEPCINLTEQGRELCESVHCKIVDGKVNRKDAERAWKIARKALGEPTNTEYLRKRT